MHFCHQEVMGIFMILNSLPWFLLYMRAKFSKSCHKNHEHCEEEL
jgi:hypothetical protein